MPVLCSCNEPRLGCIALHGKREFEGLVAYERGHTHTHMSMECASDRDGKEQETGGRAV
jgi:hypothetical protein